MKWTYLLVLCFCAPVVVPVHGQDVLLAANGTSVWKILLPLCFSEEEQQAAAIVQRYFTAVTGVQLPVLVEEPGIAPQQVISVGATRYAATYAAALTPEAFVVAGGKEVIVLGGKDKGIVYAAYTFVEQVLGCRKWNAGPAYTPYTPVLAMPLKMLIKEAPAFNYREAYFPASADDEYLNWHHLHRFEDKWGLWGHSFFKLLPPDVYFKKHPKYYSLIDGERKAVQLCLSNKKVLKIVVATLQQRMAAHPEATYWSISPNDDGGYCECSRCRRVDEREGGPQGALLRFVNAVAARFPDKKFTMLAYGYSVRPTLVTRPATNVYIQLSNIDAGRSQALEQDKAAAAFRKNLKGWRDKTDRILLWDYCTQFTAYVAPFPSTATFEANARWCKQQGITGIFEQGSGDTYSDMADYKAYMLAAVLWNPFVNTDSLTQVFMNGYYGKAAPYMLQYLQLLQQQVAQQHVPLDIYGNPVNAHSGYLSAMALDAYSSCMDKAVAVTEGNTLYQQRVTQVRLAHEYTVLQQARFYGLEPNGVFVQDAHGGWSMKKGMMQRVQAFVNNCKMAGVKELSEGGLSPDAYYSEWKQIEANGVTSTIALHAPVKVQYAFMPEYPAKGSVTLTDGTPGYSDYSYNWLCFYNTPMVATVDLGALKAVHVVTVHFLQDARHWFFAPGSVMCGFSEDGLHTTQQMEKVLTAPQEDYTVQPYAITFRYAQPVVTRYITITAAQLPGLPLWRKSKYKHPAIACDEIWVQ
ncbi:protein of unknown function [Filimonas lacunae]|uniref:Glycosyl hydrolase family 67 N-terminus n=1 Tax=Filimonas lacunae TaxID=477680 RepID=A0A173MK78_9BACT|nr:DUF4838 domain-containing protein [Filimonas lacunae]BAV07900.1 beta-hexosaminidase precursor [Filimonas lacunae]SIT06231.1 protein of unknown function [Filimonas lacunae]